jgi:hypothetical protein
LISSATSSRELVKLEGSANRRLITEANGFYRFNDVETAGFYTVTLSISDAKFNETL